MNMIKHPRQLAKRRPTTILVRSGVASLPAPRVTHFGLLSTRHSRCGGHSRGTPATPLFPSLSFSLLSLFEMGDGDKTQWLDTRLVYFLASLTLAMAVILLVESIITIVVNVKNHALREMNCARFIINLAACTALLGLLMSTWMVIKMAVEGDRYSWFRCTIFKISIRFLHTVTVFTLCCLSLDRYVYICWPLHYYQLLTPRRCNLLVAACWLLAGLLLGIPTLPSFHLCTERESKFRVSRPFMISYIACYGVAVVVVMVLYSLVAWEVSTVFRQGVQEGQERAKRRMRRSIFTVVFIQLVLSAPDMVIQLVSLQESLGSIRAASISPILLMFAQLLFLPVYAWKNTQYRTAIVQLLSPAFAFWSTNIVRFRTLSNRSSSEVKAVVLESNPKEVAS